MSIEKLDRVRPSLFRKEAIAFASERFYGNYLDIKIDKSLDGLALCLGVFIFVLLGVGASYMHGRKVEPVAMTQRLGDVAHLYPAK
ncbi:hypothetical protein [Pseudomonas sp. HS6]|uniref:hypothetical protein n=1 Tax=Pseudomonas sp. HS6 TaxID=2850559 RepID=UPI002019E13D|nr:hypothetical protein [Pseudomonas sp. HS6]UQS17128.1 hypothetical protein JJN09_09825 [Pseudomonas sp. HS6]